MIAGKYDKKLNLIDIHVGTEDILIEALDVREIYIPGERIVPVPLANKVIVGIIDVRGVVYTVLSLKHLLYGKGDSTISKQTPILLLSRSDGVNEALLVDAVNGIKNVPASAFQKKGIIIETEIDTNLIKSIGATGNEKHLVINLEKVLKIEMRPATLLTGTSQEKKGDEKGHVPSTVQPGTSKSARNVPAITAPSIATQRASPSEAGKIGTSSAAVAAPAAKPAPSKAQPSEAETQIQLTETQRDALQEVGNIGAGNAANALAKMINQRVDIDIPSVQMLAIEKFAADLVKKKEKYFISWSNITGTTRATVLVMFKAQDILNLAALILEDEKKPKISISKLNKMDDFPEDYKSAIVELGHILGSHYTSAIGDLLNINLMTEVPDNSIDNGSHLVQILQDEVGMSKLYTLVILTSLTIKEYKVEGQFMFIPEKGTLKGLLDALTSFFK